MYCPRCRSGFLCEDIEPTGHINLSCVDCGEIIPTDRRMSLSPGSPVMRGSLLDRGIPEEPDYFEDRQSEAGKAPRRSRETITAMVTLWHATHDTAAVARAYGITTSAADGVLRRNMGNEFRRRNTIRGRVDIA